jgi:uncharacterized protein (TIGR02599 family)
MFQRSALNLPSFCCRSKNDSGFTLVEMMVAITVLAVILATISAILLEITRAWKSSSGTTESFRDTRAAFEAMTRTISHATLNTYYDYVDANGNFRTPANASTFVPSTYARQSDLQFVSGTTKSTLLSTVAQIPSPITHAIFFQAPLGETDENGQNGTQNYTALNSTLNACGFYVTYGADPSVPTFLPGNAVPVRYRYRLMQFTEPTEYLSIYDSQTGAPLAQGTSPSVYDKWFLGPLGLMPNTSATSPIPTSVSQLAQNVIALIILPELSPSDQAANPTTILAPNYDYDSRNSANGITSSTFNQLPPEVDITMVAIDEASALKLGNTTTPPNLSQGSSFTTSSLLPQDLANLENNLSATPGNAAGNHIPLHFRVFHSEVAMQSAKWSK